MVSSVLLDWCVKFLWIQSKKGLW